MSGEQEAARRAARAIDALRRGWTITIKGSDAHLHVRAIETAAEYSASSILLSTSRAATLKLVNQHAAADTQLPVMIAAPEGLDATLATAIADPALDLRHPMKGPFAAEALPDAKAASAAMELARHAGLLPAFLVSADAEASSPVVEPDDVSAFADAGRLEIAARALLPVAANEDAEIIAFRSDADAADHVALIVGKRDESIPIVRLHSECLTGDVLGSLKCDCGPQLHGALEEMTAASWGILLYLRQEGRGIGLVNKLRAYALQDQGFDTVDANTRLGFAVDARDFSIAARMLKLLSVSKLKLLTNNPEKVAGIEAEGISVTERLPIKIEANPYNADYLATKKDRTGHKL